MFNTEQKLQFSEIIEELGNYLDITENQHNDAVKSYKFVGEWLSAEGSPLSIYEPEILPQGSFMLGTMIQPVNPDDDLDIDLVCRLNGKQLNWTQYNLKQIVGDRLLSHGIIRKLVVIPDGRRCWTLKYSEGEKFHLDVLPAIVSKGYKMIFNKAFASSDFKDTESLAIRITDKKDPLYRSSTDTTTWLKCNPFGYGIWFGQQAALSLQKTALLFEAVQPVPKFQKTKLPLQRVVQILKRHRDMMFNHDEHKPISIIITTIAARSYNKESNITDALLNIIDKMPQQLEERYSPKHGRMIKWISNPVNPEENFADKWVDEPQKERNFFSWIHQVRKDITDATNQRGIHMIQESMKKPFGREVISKAFDSYAENQRRKRESGILKMAPATGILGSVGNTVKNHNFHGEKEK